jgi:hypothetical protein
MKHATYCWCGARVVWFRISLHTYDKQRDWPRKPDGTVDVAAIPMHDKRVCERGHWQYEAPKVEQLSLLEML